MTKIDESKQYKFSEIIAMLENKELAEGTVIRRKNKMYSDKVLKVESNVVGEVGLISMFEKESIAVAVTLLDINSFWSIGLPKEDKFYLKAPKLFARGLYLNYNKQTHAYFLGSLTQTEGRQTKFTKKEINTMNFDTNFFGDPIKAEQADE
ncbi:hypothetical protein [Carnobacterium maltaromaticum]|uniref:hypothetical protein n=1 Tax=Carnobacterium maltaromaticum TaxID=2751 RepID=UPI00026C8A89|nr:hypothetical protein [Carnobacterium maltaromaticum]